MNRTTTQGPSALWLGVGALWRRQHGRRGLRSAHLGRGLRGQLLGGGLLRGKCCRWLLGRCTLWCPTGLGRCRLVGDGLGRGTLVRGRLVGCGLPGNLSRGTRLGLGC